MHDTSFFFTTHTHAWFGTDSAFLDMSCIMEAITGITLTLSFEVRLHMTCCQYYVSRCFMPSHFSLLIVLFSPSMSSMTCFTP